MRNLSPWALSLILIFFSFRAQALGERQSAEDLLLQGLRINEEFLHFLDSRSCELGILNNCDRPLSVADIALLKDHFRSLESWKREAFEYLLPAHDKLQGRIFVLKKNEAHRVRSLMGVVYISLKKDESRTLEFIDHVMISAVTRLVMYDSFFRLSGPLSKAKKMRAILVEDMGEESDLFRQTLQVAMDPENWKRTQTDLNFLSQTQSFRSQPNSFFEQYLEKSYTAKSINEKDLAFKMKNLFMLNSLLNHAQMGEVFNRVMGKISQIFGNTIGQVQTRDGKLKKLSTNPALMKEMKEQMRPLDILFEKTPFRLTDQFIPGFYGHAAIWLGQPEELAEMRIQYLGKEIALLEHPKVLPYLERMSRGELVVEALRLPGVTMNTLEHFMDVDDLVVVRPVVTDPGEYILKTLEMIGRPYDFNFDLETESSIICSELIYRVFDQYDWPVIQEMGRYTMSPDHLAWKAVDSCFDPILMYHDGRAVTENLSAELRRLLEGRGGITYTPTGNCL